MRITASTVLRYHFAAFDAKTGELLEHSGCADCDHCHRWHILQNAARKPHVGRCAPDCEAEGCKHLADFPFSPPPSSLLYRSPVEKNRHFEQVEAALYGKQADDVIRVRVLPGPDGTGKYDPDDVRPMPMEALPEGSQVGDFFETIDQDKDPCLVKYVAKGADGMAMIDFNHALAGRTIEMELEIISVRHATKEEERAGKADEYEDDDDQDDED